MRPVPSVPAVGNQDASLPPVGPHEGEITARVSPQDRRDRIERQRLRAPPTRRGCRSMRDLKHLMVIHEGLPDNCRAAARI
jgi:hypothetical protein